MKKKIFLYQAKKTPSIYCVFFAELFYQAKNILKYTRSSLQNWRNNYFRYSTKHKKASINILGLLCRFEEINIFMILLSIKSPLIYWVFFAEFSRIEKQTKKYHSTKHEKNSLDLQIWRNKYFHYSTKQKHLLKILGILCRIEREIFLLFYQAKKLLKYTGSSLRN